MCETVRRMGDHAPSNEAARRPALDDGRVQRTDCVKYNKSSRTMVAPFGVFGRVGTRQKYRIRLSSFVRYRSHDLCL